jgi:hypothetical protein
VPRLNDNGVRIHFIGRRHFSRRVQANAGAESNTAANQRPVFNVFQPWRIAGITAQAAQTWPGWAKTSPSSRLDQVMALAHA